MAIFNQTDEASSVIDLWIRESIPITKDRLVFHWLIHSITPWESACWSNLLFVDLSQPKGSESFSQWLDCFYSLWGELLFTQSGTVDWAPMTLEIYISISSINYATYLYRAVAQVSVGSRSSRRRAQPATDMMCWIDEVPRSANPESRIHESCKQCCQDIFRHWLKLAILCFEGSSFQCERKSTLTERRKNGSDIRTTNRKWQKNPRYNNWSLLESNAA